MAPRVDAEDLADGWAPCTRQDGSTAMGRQATVRRGASAGVLDRLAAWELQHGSRWQISPDGILPPWQFAPKRLMGSPAVAPVVVRELCHATSKPLGDDLVDLGGVLPLSGSAVLDADNLGVHLPRATAVTFAGLEWIVRVPATTAVKWRGLVETRVRTLLVMTTGEGCRWGDTTRCAKLPVPPDGDSSDEGLPASDHSKLDGSANDASSDGG